MWYDVSRQEYHMPTPTSKNQPVHVPSQDESQFVLHPGDNDAFVRTGRQIIEACRLSISISVWLDELKEMFAQVREWCAQRPEKIQGCLAAGRGSKIVLFFVPQGKSFHFDLADEMTELNRELVTRYNIGTVEVGQIPASEIERFLDPEGTKILLSLR
jgi:hypothetical protein